MSAGVAETQGTDGGRFLLFNPRRSHQAPGTRQFARLADNRVPDLGLDVEDAIARQSADHNALAAA